MVPKNAYPLCNCLFFFLLVILVCRFFAVNKGSISILYASYWISIVLILIFWILICLLDFLKVFGGDVLTNYNDIRKEIQKHKKAVVYIFVFFQIINNVLFGTLGLFNMHMTYDNELNILCITILFVASWEYFNYYKLFRLEILKKTQTAQIQEISVFLRWFLIIIDTIILLYQVIISLYFVLLTNQSVSHRTLNSYLKLLFILFIFKILGTGCQKYLKKLLLCASLFALIAYDWYLLITVLSGENEDEFYFRFFIIIFIFTQLFFFHCAYTLYREWNIYRSDRRPMNIFGPNLNRNENDGHIKVGLTDEEIKQLNFEYFQNSFENSEKIVCTICTFDVSKGDQILKINCGHIFHSKCVIPWLQINKVCPNCRQDLNIIQKNLIGLHRDLEMNQV